MIDNTMTKSSKSSPIYYTFIGAVMEFNDLISKVTLVKDDARLFFDLLEVCRGMDNIRIHLVECLKEKGPGESYVLEASEQFFLLTSHEENQVIHAELSDILYESGNPSLIKREFAMRSLVWSKDGIKLQYHDKCNNLNEQLTFNVMMNDVGVILGVQSIEKRVLIFPG